MRLIESTKIAELKVLCGNNQDTDGYVSNSASLTTGKQSEARVWHLHKQQSMPKGRNKKINLRLS